MDIFIDNLPDTYGDEELKKLFTPYGEVTFSKVSLDESGQSKGYGFVKMPDSYEAETAIRMLHNTKPADFVYRLRVKRKVI